MDFMQIYITRSSKVLWSRGKQVGILAFFDSLISQKYDIVKGIIIKEFIWKSKTG